MNAPDGRLHSPLALVNDEQGGSTSASAEVHGILESKIQTLGPPGVTSTSVWPSLLVTTGTIGARARWERN